MHTRFQFFLSPLSAALLLASPQVRATLLAYEAFAIGAPTGYTVGALPGQNPTGTAYATSAWTVSDSRMAGDVGAGGTFPANRGVVATGLDHGTYLTTGGSFRPNTFLNSAGNVGGIHTASRDLTAAATTTGLANGDFLWFSGFIQAPDAALPTGSSLLMGYYGTASGGRGMLVGFSGDQIAVGGRGFNASASSTAFAITPTGAYSAGQTYFFVARLGLNDGASSAGGNGTSNDLFELWLDPSDPSSLANLGAADIALPTYAYALAGDVNLLRAYSATAGGENLNPDLLRTAGFDEFRLGTSLDAVLPAVIPEPGSQALVVLSLVGLLLARRPR